MTTAPALLIDSRPATTAVVTPLPSLRAVPDRIWGDHPAARRRRPALSPAALLGMAKHYAAGDVAWSSPDGRPLTERSYRLVQRDDDSEVWLIHWPSGGHLELHDHGGSSGAFWVVDGLLEEQYVRHHGPVATLSRRHHAGSSGIGFEGHYVHDVRNGGATMATSVHAYSPPLPSMTYYHLGKRYLSVERTEVRGDGSWTP